MGDALGGSSIICLSEISLRNYAYIISVALQLSAGLLLVGNVATSRQKIIDAYGEQHSQIAFYTKSKRLVAKEGLMDVVKKSWINKLSFFYLSIGYLVGVFGDAPQDRWNALIVIVVITAFLWYATRKWARYASDNFATITRYDLKMEGGVGFCEIDEEEETKTDHGSSGEEEYIVRIRKIKE